MERNVGIMVILKEHLQKSSLSDFETLQKYKILGEQTAADRSGPE